MIHQDEESKLVSTTKEKEKNFMKWYQNILSECNIIENKYPLKGK